MPKKDVPIGHLQNFLPPHTYEPVYGYLQQYKVHLTITKERKTILGDYRHRTQADTHRISVNGNLNPYSFLITLLHELAHLLTFEQFGNRVQSHGKEWKSVYGRLLAQFLQHRIFPADIEHEIKASMVNPAASSCAEEGLLRVLRKYDKGSATHRLVEDLPFKSLFSTADGRIFRKEEKLRKRFKCLEISTGRLFLFSGLYEVTEIIAKD